MFSDLKLEKWDCDPDGRVRNHELIFSHRHTQITIIYRASINGNYLKFRTNIFFMTKDKKKEPQQTGIRRADMWYRQTHTPM